MPKRRPAMRHARQVEQSLTDAVNVALPSMAIDLDMTLEDASPAILTPSQADKLALIDASFEALAARCSAERLPALKQDAKSLRKAISNQA